MHIQKYICKMLILVMKRIGREDCCFDDFIGLHLIMHLMTKKLKMSSALATRGLLENHN